MSATAPSADSLAAAKAGTKHVATKVATGLDPQAVAAYAKIYTDNGGDMGKIASQLKVTWKDPKVTCKSAEDFAKRFLEGMLAKD